MKKSLLFAFCVASLSIATLAGGAFTYAAFVARREVSHYTTVKRVIKFSEGNATWWSNDGAKTGIYYWKDGSNGSFANGGAFMSGSNGVYYATLPSDISKYDYIIFVRCKSTATVANWDDKLDQTVNIPYTGAYDTFTLINDTYGLSGDDIVYGEGSGVGDKRGGRWSTSTNYTYSPT